jgi:hypothetical protein
MKREERIDFLQEFKDNQVENLTQFLSSRKIALERKTKRLVPIVEQGVSRVDGISRYWR